MPRPTVPHTRDFDRILALPRRTLDRAEAEEWARYLTQKFALPGAEVALRPWQGQAIAECVMCRGGWLAFPVGIGKTLLTWLLPIAFNAERSVIIMPAVAIRSGKTWSDFGGYVGKWRSPKTPPMLFSFEELALDKNADLLERIAPTLVMLDESDVASNPDGAATRRIDRYRLAHPSRDEVVFVCMTGTPGRLSIMNYWHPVMWCLTEDAPLPIVEPEAKLLASALDHSTRGQSALSRPSPGPWGATLAGAREFYRRRLAETPGVLIVDEDSAGDVPLTFRWRFARECLEMNEAYARFLLDFENPGGLQVTVPLTRWTLDGMMGCGLYSYYDPPPPPEWYEARRNFAKACRVAVARSTRSTRPIDTEFQVIRRYPHDPAVVAWLAIRDTFDTEKAKRYKWFTDSTVQSALDWLAEVHAAGRSGIVWSGSPEFGRRLSTVAGLPYYGAKGRAEGGCGLHAADPRRSLIASSNANKRIFNLQAWSDQLVVWPPQSAKLLEQLVGRGHRSGSTREVVFDVLITSGGTIDAFEAAVAEAKFCKSTVTLTQKILRARIERGRATITDANQYRWASRVKGSE